MPWSRWTRLPEPRPTVTSRTGFAVRDQILVPVATAATSPGPNVNVAGLGGWCLDIANYGTANGSTIQMWDCTGAWNQFWYFKDDGSGAIRNPQSGRCLGIQGGGTANGTPVILWDCVGAANQVWERQPNGSLRNPASGRCLDMSKLGDPGRHPGTDLRLHRTVEPGLRAAQHRRAGQPAGGPLR